MLKEGCGQYGNAVRGRLRLKNEGLCQLPGLAARIRTAIVSDAGADDVESWPRSPIGPRVDVTIFLIKWVIENRIREFTLNRRKKRRRPGRRPPATPSSPTTKTAIPKAWFNDF